MACARLVVPCYNEEARLLPAAFMDFLRSSTAADLIFVDDGSRDRTAGVLQLICAAFPRRASLLRLPRNAGKAEAVRQGLLAALEGDTPFVGFWDADLATPLESIALFLKEFDEHPNLEMVIGARVRLLGRTIDRRAMRHYTGRVFATLVSLMLRLPVYDTQCGAKLFKATPVLRRIFDEPFLSRWIFDVEILARLGIEQKRAGGPPPERCVAELPLPAWRDVKGSKIRPRDFVRVGRDLWLIQRWLQRARRERDGAS